MNMPRTCKAIALHNASVTEYAYNEIHWSKTYMHMDVRTSARLCAVLVCVCVCAIYTYYLALEPIKFSYSLCENFKIDEKPVKGKEMKVSFNLIKQIPKV